jgi:hypothetical protein
MDGDQIGEYGSKFYLLDWRKFQLQFEVAAERMDDKYEREEFDMLYDKLSPFWQEKVGHKGRRVQTRRPKLGPHINWGKFGKRRFALNFCIVIISKTPMSRNRDNVSSSIAPTQKTP